VPLSAEWLSGTEISRWVALPWSSELEEVIKGIEPGDQIELTMSNSDVVMFQVYSIQRMTMNELMSSEATKPSLLVMLYDDQNKDEAYWVITAFP
jgi:3-methyladenine DNA glycosylase AlkC